MVELIGDNCVASAGVIFAKKAGLPQLVAGSIKSQGVALPPHSKFVVFTKELIVLARLGIDSGYFFFGVAVFIESCCDVKGRRIGNSRGTVTSRSCMQMVLSYFACHGCAWKLHLYRLYPEKKAICCCEQTKWQPPSVQLQPFVQVDVTQLSVVVVMVLIVPTFALISAPPYLPWIDMAVSWETDELEE